MSCKKNFFFLFWLFSTVLGTSFCTGADQVQFFVLICSYNNAQWCKKNLDSVFCQTYPYWHIYYVDDCSTDGTGDIVKDYIQQRGFSTKCTVIRNLTNKKAMANYYDAIHQCDPHKVVVNLDGDDWLAHERVLEKVAAVYKDPDVWMTYGSFRIYPNGKRGCANSVPLDVCITRSYRKYNWVFSHLRTYYAALFQKISKEDLFFKGEFFKSATDLAQMYPMIEMASNGHYRFIKEILYIYNGENPSSVFRIHRSGQSESEAFIRSKPPYQALNELF